MARIYLSNLGCKLNQAELEAYARRFESDGHELVAELSAADVHVVNSCTVTHVAARDSRKLARRAARVARKTGSAVPRTVLTGCYATEQPEVASGLAGVDLVVDNSDKDNLVECIYGAFPDLEPGPRTSTAVPVSFVPLAFGHTRAAIKVEDGCNMTCAFCIIPSTRGRQRSRPVEVVAEELQSLVDRGTQEVVVTGVQISSYRDGDRRLFDLVEHLLEKTSVPRLRLTSIAPWQFEERLLDLWPNDRLCRHFHLSLQSGCHQTLQRMRRPYSTDQYRDLLQLIRDRIPGVAITTDVIVGFPGETEGEFEASLEFVRQAKFARTHVFPYSERPGTRSAAMTDSVSPLEKKARARCLRAVAEDSSADFARSQLGLPLEVLWERGSSQQGSSDRRGYEGVSGTSDNYIRVIDREGEPARVGLLSTVTAACVKGDKLMTSAPIAMQVAPSPLDHGRTALPIITA